MTRLKLGGALLVLGLMLALGAFPAGATPPTLIHWWKADGDTTDSVAGNNGALVGDTTYAPGNSGQAFSFDGDNDYVSVPAPSPDDHLFAGSFTIDAWVKSTQTTGDHEIVAKYECANACPTGNAASEWEILLHDGTLEGVVRDADQGGPDAGGQVIDSAGLIADGVFHHVTFIRDVGGNALCLAVDGQSVVSHSLNPNVAGPLQNLDGEPDPLTIGAVIQGGGSTPINDLQGLVDDVQLYDGGTCPTPTAVRVTSFTARRSAGGTVVRWRTGQEASVLGFNVYRDGLRVNRRLLVAHGGLTGARYRLTDHRAGAVYRLQAVRIDGGRAWAARVAAGP